MSTIKANTVKPKDFATDLTLGASGYTVTLPGNDLRVNTVKDKGGNSLWTSDGSGNLSSVNAGLKGNLLLLNTTNATDQASVSFTSGIDSTYDLYMFKFIDVNPATNSANWTFQMDIASGSSYNQTMTSTFFRALHSEDDTSTATLGYDTGNDQQQGTGFQILAQNVMNDADASVCGELFLFSPSNTSFIKRFCARSGAMRTGPLTSDVFVAGYWTTSTAALTKIQFKFDSGNFDGTIKMYGLL